MAIQGREFEILYYTISCEKRIRLIGHYFRHNQKGEHFVIFLNYKYRNYQE